MANSVLCLILLIGALSTDEHFRFQISPLALRGIFTCCVGVAYGVGPLVAFLIINYTGDVDTPWAYRTVFCCQFGFAGLVTIFVPFLPE